MIPKVQIERAIGPIIGFFLAEALSARMGEEIVTLCPEFPIRKARVDSASTGNNQSTNIDWLMYNRNANELILLELKTTDTAFRPEQAQVYKELQTAIVTQNSAEFLIDDLLEISKASHESGKYRAVLQRLEREFPDLRSSFSSFKTASVIYLAPHATLPSDWKSTYSDWTWFSFRDLPKDIEHSYKAHWPAVHNSLLTIDDLTKRIRNGEDLSAAAGRSRSKHYRFEEVVDRCRTQGDAIVVSFMKWRNNIASMDIHQLATRRYKCESSSERASNRIASNWISGDDFLRHVERLSISSGKPNA